MKKEIVHQSIMGNYKFIYNITNQKTMFIIATHIIKKRSKK